MKITDYKIKINENLKILGVTIFRESKLRALYSARQHSAQVHTPRNPILAQSISTLLHGFMRVLRVMRVTMVMRVMKVFRQ